MTRQIIGTMSQESLPGGVAGFLERTGYRPPAEGETGKVLAQFAAQMMAYGRRPSYIQIDPWAYEILRSRLIRYAPSDGRRKGRRRLGGRFKRRRKP